jgi:hypothetical protein
MSFASVSEVVRLLQASGPEGKVETILEGVSRDAAKPLGEALRVTEIAAARDLRAARYRVPGCIGPLDLCCRRHGSS